MTLLPLWATGEVAVSLLHRSYYRIFTLQESKQPLQSTSSPTIIPRLRSREYMEKLQSMDYPANQLPIAEPFTGDLQLLFGIDERNSFQLVTRLKLGERRIDLASLRTLTLQSCATIADKLSVHTQG